MVKIKQRNGATPVDDRDLHPQRTLDGLSVRYRVSGVAAAVHRGGQELWRGASGVASLETNQAPSDFPKMRARCSEVAS
jgi:hypothetical protein